jgi:predicted DNA-binding protein with PD1-like motif
LVSIAKKEKIQTALVSGIGGFRRAEIAYYTPERKKYDPKVFAEQMEVVSLVGNIALRDGSPFLHAHVSLSRDDMSVVGGHLVSAEVNPFVEIILTPTSNKANRRFNEETGLSPIEKITP